MPCIHCEVRDRFASQLSTRHRRDGDWTRQRDGSAHPAHGGLGERPSVGASFGGAAAIDELNTSDYETSPFVTGDGMIVYFSCRPTAARSSSRRTAAATAIACPERSARRRRADGRPVIRRACRGTRPRRTGCGFRVGGAEARLDREHAVGRQARSPAVEIMAVRRHGGLPALDPEPESPDPSRNKPAGRASTIGSTAAQRWRRASTSARVMIGSTAPARSSNACRSTAAAGGSTARTVPSASASGTSVGSIFPSIAARAPAAYGPPLPIVPVPAPAAPARHGLRAGERRASRFSA